MQMRFGLLVVVGCLVFGGMTLGSCGSTTGTAPAVAGPALLFFYTDN